MKKLFLWGSLAIIVGCIIWAFFVFYERYDKEVNVGYSSEAKANPFLAAQLFLENSGVSVVESVDVLDFAKIGHGETVFLSNVDDMILTQSQIDEALEWVEAGGNLIVGVGAEIKGSASFLERFDIDPIEYNVDYENFLGGEAQTASERLRELNEEIEEQEKSGETPAEDTLSFNDILDQDWDDQKKQFKVQLNEELGELTLQVLDRMVLNHPLLDDIVSDDGSSESNDDWYGDYEDNYTLDTIFRDEKGARLLEFGYGKGSFTALSSSNFFVNESIGKADHAFFLAYLIPKESTVRFFYNVVSPSIWTLIKQHFTELLISMLVLLFLWLWRSSVRVQGISHEVTNQRRAFSEHLKSSAEFLISKEQYDLLLVPIQSDIDSQMKTLKPGYLGMAQEEQKSALSVASGFPKEVIQSWLDALDNIENQEHMIASIKVGNAIRNKL